MGIYTRRGDGGETDLGNGERTAKFSLRVEAYGTLDELSACLGMARAASAKAGTSTASGIGEGRMASAAPSIDLSARILEIQKQLSVLTGWLSVPGSAFPEAAAGDDAVSRMESEIDAMMKAAGPLNGFIMPGENVLEAALHLSRTVCRRAERRLAELAAGADASPAKKNPAGEGARVKGGMDSNSSAGHHGQNLPPSPSEDMRQGLKYLNRLSDWLFAASRL